jgi:Kef-type K+ transport system membrane component KefB
MFSVVCVALLFAALAAESIGIHALFGAFLLGALIPHDSALAYDVAGRLEDLAVVLLLPVFFAYTGMRTQIGLVTGTEELIACALIIIVASLGKFGGTTFAARATGLGWRDSMALGVLMNTRGLMELVVLNIGLDLKLVSPTLFAMFVTMALVTTLATTPILHLLRLEAPQC